jgi:hypothetical protein
MCPAIQSRTFGKRCWCDDQEVRIIAPGMVAQLAEFVATLPQT